MSSLSVITHKDVATKLIQFQIHPPPPTRYDRSKKSERPSERSSQNLDQKKGLVELTTNPFVNCVNFVNLNFL